MFSTGDKVVENFYIVTGVGKKNKTQKHREGKQLFIAATFTDGEYLWWTPDVRQATHFSADCSLEDIAAAFGKQETLLQEVTEAQIVKVVYAAAEVIDAFEVFDRDRLNSQINAQIEEYEKVIEKLKAQRV
jgi:hypothetical protein